MWAFQFSLESKTTPRNLYDWTDAITFDDEVPLTWWVVMVRGSVLVEAVLGQVKSMHANLEILNGELWSRDQSSLPPPLTFPSYF